ncbi:MAG: putative Ig domain-containing protein [Hydrogenophaga sp.]|nr:putative Ig domain-containing protein [Hydrogenophaga sp.]
MSTQRNRRLLLTLPACAVPMLSACGGGGDLTYDTEQSLYMVGDAITPNNPHTSSTTTNVPASWKPKFFVNPALPAGLVLNAQTGVISGTPTKLKRQATHTVTALSLKGSAEAKLRITVTGRGAWTPAAALPGARRFASLTRLSDRTVLAAGGDMQFVATTSAQIYESASGSWRPAASMHLARSEHQAVALADGRVLVLGGRLSLVDATGAAEIYNPATDAWTETGSMKETRAGASAHLLPNGKVLVMGGYTVAPGLTYRDSAELYDPSTGEWTLQTERMSLARGQHAGVLLPGGLQVLLVGGTGTKGYAQSIELYTLGSATQSLVTYAGNGGPHCAVVLDDGSVLIVTSGIERVRRLNPATMTWTETVLSDVHVAPTMNLLSDGRVLLAGGTGDNSCRIFNPDVNLWTAAAPMNGPRQFGSSVLLGDGSVLAVGGVLRGAYLETAERYIP